METDTAETQKVSKKKGLAIFKVLASALLWESTGQFVNRRYRHEGESYCCSV